MPYTKLFEQLDTNDLVLTPNRRLSRYLSHAYQQTQQSAHQSVRFLAYDTYLQTLYRELCQHQLTPIKTVLNVHQQFAIWQSIIEKNYQGLHSSNALVKQALTAWQLLNDYLIDIQDSRLGQTTDSRHFQKWCQHYQSLLEKKMWIDHTGLHHAILSTNDGHPLFANRIFCVGFLDPSPAQQALLDQHPCVNFYKHTKSLNQTTQKIGFHQAQQELNSIAEMISTVTRQQPQATIACIIPNLNQCYRETEQTFRQTFDCLLQENHELPFTLSFGQSLTQYPLIHTALMLLSLTQHNSKETIKQLLLSPFISASESERQTRALLVNHINTQAFAINLFQLKLYCQQQAPQLSEMLTNMDAYPQDFVKIEDCIQLFIQRLNTFGFPGEQALRSHDYQLLNRFQTLLHELKSLKLIKQQWTVREALSHLRQLCHDTLFQAESNPAAKIHILGLLEASDIPFDYVWQTQLNENAWPQNHGINPFLPASLQADLNMPGANQQHHIAFHEQWLQQRIQLSQHFYASYIAQEEDIPVHASYGIAHFKTQECEHRPSLAGEDKLEAYQDWQAPLVENHEHLRGGSQIIKRQAICPFKAFAESRLNALPLETATTGFNYRIKGQLLHSALEKLWQQLQNSDNLHRLSEQQQQALIQSCVQNVLKPYRNQLNYYITLEEKRLIRLLNKFLLVEKERQPFTVAAIEKKIELQLGTLKLTLRIDRIDHLANGGHVLIDYKSSAHSMQHWLGERPEEPQLPLYSLCFNHIPAVMCFALLRSNECRYIGISVTNSIIPKVKPLAQTSLKDLMLEWRDTFLTLSHDFTTGSAMIDPKNGPLSCQSCQLHSLCRIHDDDTH